MIRIAVCDDEQKIVNLLCGIIKDHLPECAIEEYNLGTELLDENGKFDIYFLDICMRDLDGMETAKRIRESNAEALIVFVTGEKGYVYDAFDVRAFHYLLKPINENKLIEVLDNAVRYTNQMRAEKRQIFIPMKGRNVTLNVDDIVYLENERHKIIIFTVKDTVECYGTMTEMEDKLGEAFFRCHRGYLVNMAYIAEYNSDSIILTSGEKIYLSRDKYQEFVRLYMRYCLLRSFAWRSG